MCNCKLITVFLLLSMVCIQSEGQAPQRNMYEFDFIKNTNPWLTSANATGLGLLQVDRTSFVEAYFNKGDGALVPVEGSDNSLLAGAQTESFVRVSDKIAFHGKLSYSYFHGKNMGGHYLMDPSYNPINFVENTEDNNGVKVRELYYLRGGMSYSFNEHWSLGLDFEYETGNYAKRKDPRPQSSWMDLDMTAGVRFSPKDNFSVGLNARYARTMERIASEIFGTTDRQYYTLIDYGGYFGRVENLDNDNGYVGSTSMPMINVFYGAALQLVFGKQDNVLFFNELSWSNRSGYYGLRGSSDVVFCEFSGNILSYEGSLGINRGRTYHRISLYGEYEGLINNENIYQRTSVPGESTVVEYFGQREALNRTDINASLSYTGYLGVEQFRPKWEYGIVVDAAYRTFRATYYPYYRDQNVTSLTGMLHGRRNIQVSKNIFTVSLAAGYFMGFGTKNSDGALASSSTDNHRTNDSYLNKDFEYDTAARVSGSIGFRYTRLFGSKIAAYIDVRDTYNHTLEKPEFLADGYRNAFTVSVGCAF